MDKGPPLRQEIVAQALSSAASRQVLALCIRRALPVKAISDQASLPLASAYRQVNSLVAWGLLVVERSAMTPDGKPYDLYRSRVRRARVEVSPSGVQVEWEPNEVVGDRLIGMWNQMGG